MPDNPIEPLIDSTEVHEMDEAIWVLRLELPAAVYDDLRRRWVAMRRLLGDDVAE